MKYCDFLGTQLSKVGLGTVRFGSLISDEKAFALMDCFFAGGGNVIDTARGYFQEIGARGSSETTIGKWIKLRNNRSKIILVAKGGSRYSRKGEKEEYTPCLDRISMLKEVRESLDALQTGYIDIYLVHRDDVIRPIEEIVETMQEVKTLSNAKAIGVSNWSIKRLIEANHYAKRHGFTTFTAIEVWWSVAEYTRTMWANSINTTMSTDLYDYMIKNEMLGIAYTFQAKGYFQKAIASGIDNIEPKLRMRIDTPGNRKKLAYIDEYCRLNKVSPTAVVTGYITSRQAKGIALAGCSTVEQIEDILNNCDYDLPQNVINELDSL
jgi:aryl-alcohol dehydrogenase-like predicted oxidoreductase